MSKTSNWSLELQTPRVNCSNGSAPGNPAWDSGPPSGEPRRTPVPGQGGLGGNLRTSGNQAAPPSQAKADSVTLKDEVTPLRVTMMLRRQGAIGTLVS